MFGWFKKKSSVPPVPDFQVASVGELLKCVADRCAGYAKHGGKFAFCRQLLTIDIDAKAKSRDEPIHDVVGDITRRDRSPQGRRCGANGRLRRVSVRVHVDASSPPKRIRRKRASVRAASTMLCSSTDSSTPWMLCVTAPKQSVGMLKSFR